MVTRRALLTAGLAAGAMTVAGCTDNGGGDQTGPVEATVPPTTPPPVRRLDPGIDDRLVEILGRSLGPTPANPDHPTYAGAVALVTVDGRVAASAVVGDALRYEAGPMELPAAERIAMRADSVFDLASLTKIYTAILALQLADEGRLDLDAPVADHLPAFGRPEVTPRLLLAHTSGLPVGARVTGFASEEARWAAVLATPLLDGAIPGQVFRYSSVGLMVVGRLVETIVGQRLDEAVRTRITGPLGLGTTGFRPTDWMSAEELSTRMVATDARSSRGLLRGVVHDDVANLLGGIAGHAGLFATAAEVAAIGQLLLDGGSYLGVRLLTEQTAARMLVNANTGLPAVDPDRPGRPSDHGLGVTLNQPWFMGRLAGPRAFGHTGFTGTSLVVDPDRGIVLVLLANRAHPNWSWANPDPVRVEVADAVAAAWSAG